MHELIVCTGPGTFLTTVDLAEISELRREPGTTIWLDLYEPTEQDVAALREEFGFHPLALEDATREQARPKVDSYGEYYFVVFYCIGYNDEDGQIEHAAINMFIGHNYLVTIHNEPITQINDTLARWQAPDSPLDQDVGALVWALLDAIVDDYFPVLDQVAEKVEAIEEMLLRALQRRLAANDLSAEKGSADRTPHRRARARRTQRHAAARYQGVRRHRRDVSAGCV